MRLARSTVVLACLLLVGVLAGCSGLSGTNGRGYVLGEGGVVEIEPADREEPIELTGEDLEGEELSLEALRGKPVVVNVWYSACEPCIVEQPLLNRVSDEMGDQVAFVGVNIRESSVETAQAYVRSQDVPYPSLYSDDGRALLAFDAGLGPRSVPATLVLDEEGRVAAIIPGAIPTEQTLKSVLERVLDE